MKFGVSIAIALTLLCNPSLARAQNDCTLIVDYETTEIIAEDGDCSTRRAPESTFKIPLAVMGFDSGILKNAHEPSWDYKPEYASNREEEKAATDPTRWERDSVVWYSQQITKKMGLEKFRDYILSFNYGNQDISGDKNKNNGLTHSWLSSSLKISPREQISFLRRLLTGELKASPHALDLTKSIIPEFSTDGWVIHGKTGSGFHREEDGTLNRDLQRGWFIGWAEKDNRTIVFAKFISDSEKVKGYAGPRAREALLKDLPALVDHHDHNKH